MTRRTGAAAGAAEPDEAKGATCKGAACAGPEAARRRRLAAGEDPEKRRQILEGALKVFLTNGFDAASMNDICRAAGVSKGTLYVYFADKEDLFDALMAQEREKLFEGMERILTEDRDLADKLHRFGQAVARILYSQQVLRAQRIVIGTVERMPEIGARFYHEGAERTQGRLTALFEREIAAGRLSMPDPVLAAAQFAELVTAGAWRRRLFGKDRKPPEPAEAEAVIASAVSMFMAAYGTDRPAGR